MRCNGFSRRSVRLNAAGGALRRPRGRRRKQRAAILGDGGHGGGHAAAASRSRRGEGRMRTMRAARLSSAIVAPILAASALAGCAPVGPDFVRPARDRFSRIQRDQRLEDRHAASERAERRMVDRVPRSGARPGAPPGRRVEPDRQG